ncbi:MAG: cytidylate kinase-like family protein, partial [bacterium]|nr:cytidylate kinase-like family protein [bacterium]
MAAHFTITPGIENRLRAWNEMAQRLPKEEKSLNPRITISREFGCQAYPLAETLYKRLSDLADSEEKWIMLDRLLMEKIAEESGIAKSELEYITHVNPTFQSMITTFVGREHAEPFTVFFYIKKTIRYFAKAGNSIIVGRGGVCLTQDLPNVFHVRLVAPFSFKVGIIMKNLKITEKEAKEHIKSRQSERDDFTRRFTKMDLSNPHLYHLLINNEKFTIGQI